ncbi:unnamed protein product [Acanthosepion pharaonis]|uniref:Uncharacterized protein n=1 Tax=Acanthosepion pharaonis TaxID=158019 RepID=A0A812DLM2_ACAPH|nr:unnamed protein product [Sepia pharaonis]
MIHQFCEKVDEYQKCVAEEEKEQITIELMQGMCEYGFEAVYKNITCLSKVITELKSTCISKRDACAISEEWFQCSLMVTQNICGEYLGYVMADLQQLYCQIFQVMTAEEPLEYDLIYAEDESEQTVDQFSIKNPIETTRRLSTKKSIKSTTPHKTNSPIITKRPHSTKKPGTTKQPHSTKKPGTTKRPHSTKKPGTTKRPHSTKKPSTTKRPHSTKMPSTTKRLATTTGQVTTTNSVRIF